MSGLEVHRAVVVDALSDLGLGWDTWPGVVTDSRLTPETRVSAVLLLLAEVEDEPAPHAMTFFSDGAVDGSDRLAGGQRPWEEVSRLRLAWTATTAATAVTSVSRARTFDDRRCALALRGAQQVCAAGQVNAKLMDALAACIARLDEVSDEAWRIKEMRGLARRVLASTTPPELLDLSLLVEGDTWAAPARQAAAELPHEQVAALVRLLSDLGPRKPSKRWLDDVEQALRPASARMMLRRWVELAAAADIVPEWPGSVIGECLGALFVGTNIDVVRAAVWATTRVASEEWASGPLGVLARRGAAHNGAPMLPEALCLKVASAAVDALCARAAPADLQVLGELLEDLQRRDLLRKVGQALGREEEAARRSDALKRTKAQAVRRKASPVPHKARSAVDSLLRQHLGTGLRGQGFRGGPRTWRRIHEDRVDVIAISAGQEFGTGQNRLDLAYGTFFDAAHPADEPWPTDRAKVSDYQLDVRIFDSKPFRDMARSDDALSEAYLEAIASRLHDVVVPLLDSLGDYACALALLKADVGLPMGTYQENNLESPGRSEILGMLALAAGDKATAEVHLERALHWAQSHAEDHLYRGDSDGTVIAAYWAGKLQQARLLP